MNYFEPPVELHGNTDQQISDIYTYLFKLANQLNLRFEETTPAAIFSEVNKALEHADSGKETNQAIADNYQQLKTLVIKTADETLSSGTSFNMNFEGMYVAKSEFGRYEQQTTSAIEANSTGITQMYEYAATLGFYADSDIDWSEYTTWQQAYIKSGLLYYDGATAKYGVAVGDVQTVSTIDDQTVVDRSNLVATFTADELAFWKGGSFSNPNKVAYLSGDTMFFPKAEITGGSIKIGSSYSATVNNQSVTLWPFYVDSDGNLNANSATIRGQLTAQSGSKLGNWNVSTAIYNGKTSLSDSSHGGIYIGTDGVYLGNGQSTETAVKLLSDGTLTANSANITGTLHAGSGSTICDWTIGKTTGTNPVSYMYTGSRSSYSSTASGIYIGSDGISMGSPTSTTSGAVGVQISSSGALTCRGATVKGNITADSLTLGTGVYINGSNITSNSITSTQIKAATITANEIAGNTITAAEIQAGAIGTSQLAANAVTTAKLDAGCVTAAKLAAMSITADKIKLYGDMTVYTTQNGTTSGGTLGYFTGFDGEVATAGIGMKATSGGQIACTTAGSSIRYASGTTGGEVYTTSGGVGLKLRYGSQNPTVALSYVNSLYSLHPTSSGGVALGSSGYKWDEAWCVNEQWEESDRDEKYDISYDLDSYIPVFDELKPASFKRVNGQSGRTHIGFIAQDVEQAILDSGKTTHDYACIAKFLKDDNDEYGYALRYGELIGLIVAKIKQQEARIAALEGA